MYESIVTLVLATALLLGSPGPVPLSLAATGATFGFNKGLPFLLGILLGLAVAITGASIGLAALFSAFPTLRFACQVIGGGYIIYVAYKIASAPITRDEQASSAPRFRDGFILNLLNPKAYAAFLAIFSQFLLPLSNGVWAQLSTAIICFIVAIIVDVLWLALGGLLKPVFSAPKQARIIRVAFATSMVVAVLYAFSL